MKQNPHLTVLLPCLLALIIIFSIIPTGTADCPLTFYPRKTMTGSITANIDQGQNRQQSYQYPLPQDSKITIRPSVAVAVTGFSLQRKTQQFGYRIQTSFYSSDYVALLFKVTTGTPQSVDKWRYIEFRFIFSDAPEILTGTQDVLEFIHTENPNVFKVSQYVPTNSLNFKSKAQVKIFISGLQIKEKQTISFEAISKIDQTIKKIQNLKNYSWNVELIKRFTKIMVSQKSPSIRITQPEFTQNGLVRFQIVVAQLQIRIFSYSYLVYLQRPSQENLYRTIDGSFSTDDQERYAYIKLTHDEMTIIGLSGLLYSSDHPGYLGFRMSQAQTSIKNFFIPQVDGQYASFNFQFFGIETLPGLVCKTCQGSPLIYEQFCVSQCPFGYAYSINSDGSFYCQRCDVENFLIAAEGGNKCVCASGHYLVSPTQSCSMCPYDCLTCNGQLCLQCDPTSQRILNKGTSRCECPPFNNRGLGLYDNSMSRICIQCNPRCKTCVGPDINQCTSCNQNRRLTNGICSCGPNLVQNPSGDCICQSPYSLTQSGQCQLSSNKCNQNQILIALSGSQRSCNCIAGYTRSILSNKCIKQCQSYQKLNYETQRCECKQGLIRNTSNSLCYACQLVLNQVYNNETKKCECVEGFEVNQAGFCISCPIKSFYKPSTDKCECIYNFYQKVPNGPCQKCTPEIKNTNCRGAGEVSRTSLSFDDGQMSFRRT